jgi:predicted DNA repair protein MutK
VSLEKEKVKGAIRTDFILSAEIIVIALGTVAAASFAQQVAVLIGIAILMTFGVYGLVAGIVKLDDAGAYLGGIDGSGLTARSQRRLGRAILLAAPYLMKALSIAGTAAMFLVGGSILAHGIPPLQHAFEQGSQVAGAALSGTLLMLADGLLGVVAGAMVLGGVTLSAKLFNKTKGGPT